MLEDQETHTDHGDLITLVQTQHLPQQLSFIWDLLRRKTSDEYYCMLDSGANVLVIPWKPGMKGEKTMCTLVGDNKAEGLIDVQSCTLIHESIL